MITVIGCGVIGLTSAVLLAENGFQVKIVARDFPPDTTSNKAAAIWTPYKAEPADKIDEWSAITYSTYTSLYSEAEAGVYPVEVYEVSRKPAERPYWLRPEYPFRSVSQAELPEGYTNGYAVEVPFIHSEKFLTYLLQRFTVSGGTIEPRELSSIDELPADSRIIVNCSGLGARELVGDSTVYPIRGQLAVAKLEGPLRYMVDTTTYPDPVYVLPRGSECVLGGTAQAHVEDLEEDPEKRERIISRCRELEPALGKVEFVRPLVGIRPGRPSVRLEEEVLEDGRVVVHNYGHGGSGFTVAWGCAAEVVQKVRDIVAAEHSGRANR